MWFIVAAVCVYALGYRFYSAFLAAKVFALDPTRATPAERFSDGRDFVPTNRWIVFGHHFAAIAGPGPLIGPTLAAQFGYLPGTLWILIGAVLGGCVQDFVALFCSIRRDGRSLGQMARDELGPIGGAVALIGVHGDHDHPHRRARPRRRERDAPQPVGDVDGGRDDPDRHADRPLHARIYGPGACSKARPSAWCCCSPPSSAAAGSTISPTLRRWFDYDAPALALDGHPLRLRGRGAAGLAAARAARLPVDVHEDRHDRRARDRDRDLESRRSRCRR